MVTLDNVVRSAHLRQRANKVLIAYRERHAEYRAPIAASKEVWTRYKKWHLDWLVYCNDVREGRVEE